MNTLVITSAALSLIVSQSHAPEAKRLTWQGYTWFVRSGEGGPGPNQWDASNVWIDAKGFLHMKIAQAKGKWTCAEIWTDHDMGFGRYQCQVKGSIDQLDCNLIFSMFSYAGPDGIKETDIEYAKWGNPTEKNGWWTVYPNDLNGIKKSTGFNFKLHQNRSTSRFTWTKEGVNYALLDGFRAPSSNQGMIQSWNYRPQHPEHQITQKPIPLHFNLWLFEGKPPADGKPVEFVIHSFTKD